MTSCRLRLPIGHVLAAALLVTVAACTSASPQVTTPSPSRNPSTPTGSSSVPSPSGSGRPGEFWNAVRIRPPDGGSFLVRGAHPRSQSRCVRSEHASLLARYPGALSVVRSTDGTLTITVTLPFERYLEGIAEVPPSWPREALEAQAVAARSYALATTGWSGKQGETLATPICATTSCQVYRGIPVPFEPSVRRWYAAVRRTSEQVLLYGDRPAETVYFSTSNGRTYGNDVVFGSAPLPYLRPVVERDDGASPTSRWSVRLPFADLAGFLNAAGEWPRGRALSSVNLDGDTIAISGAGISRSMDLATFMDAVNDWAPCLEPARYPPDSLPVTVPSKWLRVSSGRNAVALTGRG